MIQEKSFLCLMIIFFNLFLASHHADKVIFSLGTRLRGRCPSVIGSRPSKSKIINLTRLEKKKYLVLNYRTFFHCGNLVPRVSHLPVSWSEGGLQSAGKWETLGSSWHWMSRYEKAQVWGMYSLRSYSLEFTCLWTWTLNFIDNNIHVQDWTQVLFKISTSYLAELFDIFILLHIWQNCVCFVDFSPMRTLCDAYHEEFESH